MKVKPVWNKTDFQDDWTIMEAEDEKGNHFFIYDRELQDLIAHDDATEKEWTDLYDGDIELFTDHTGKSWINKLCWWWQRGGEK